jgi:prepilin-type N-terminal cleavage/methylation domain-containing protein
VVEIFCNADEIRGLCMHRKGSFFSDWQGFTLIEVMMALILLTAGLLAAGQLIFATVASDSLARAKTTAAIAAQDKIEYLFALYVRNPLANELTIGDHGPQPVVIVNPLDGADLNRYNISWNIGMVPDPRPGKSIDARIARITVTPIESGGAANRQVRLNKILNVTTVFSPRPL